MKLIFKKFFALSLLMGFVACSNQNEEYLEDLKKEEVALDVFFDKITNSYNKSDAEAVLISYEFNSKNKNVRLLSVEEAEPTWGLSFEVAERLNARKVMRTLEDKSDYEVSCDKGGKDGKGWTKKCSSKMSCGGLVYDCIHEDGGCATVCQANAVYVPEIRTFFFTDNINDLIEK
ncbi:hypothetical protein [Capnocytophaga felis]|uniref:Lipoprotein n=1 Tax=Capnocytophaga felis TaxID=2267611 RepID=A0A5M4B8C7_9FLAO|nr:hypothetical protein [Capnocytophaga felis]GET45630.1 hypothetical protein RCZ01_09320 [Capnocytophaga felis]GET47207.1 hypothetical protein RCZ02_00380 [Capnocytophaga felis]